jgi:DnaK suppressor protein
MRKSKLEVSEGEHHADLRMRLEQERNELQRRIGTSERLFRDSSMTATNRLDDIVTEKETLIERASHYRQRLRTVIRTLHRLQEGKFGICAECDEPISRKRLIALPTAEYCIECQEELEQTPHEYVN